jgi:uncharacterized membrane protein YbhN (UPF0104 family)
MPDEVRMSEIGAGGSEIAAEALTRREDARKARRKRVWRVVQVVVSLAIAVGIFWGILPKIASYGEVWQALKEMTWLELASLVAITGFNLWTYWAQMVAGLPGLRIREAAVNNEATTAVANTVPAGGVVALGLTYAMLRSWGFSDSGIALMITVTGAWNMFAKFVFPAMSLALLLVTGQATGGLLVATGVGLAILVVLGSIAGLALWKESFARALFGGAGRVVSWFRKPFHKPAVHWGRSGARFRGETIDLIRDRWWMLTWTTLLSHFALYLVLLFSLRHVGVSEQEISAIQVFAVFSFVRLLSAIPLTPGGVGIVELGYVGALILSAKGNYGGVTKDVFEAQVTAAVLVFRALTYGIQIPLGAGCYLFYLRNRTWRRTPPAHGVVEGVPTPAPG